MPHFFCTAGRHLRARLPLAVLFLTLSLPALARSGTPDVPSLEFIQNKGQWNPRVRYEAALPAGRLFVQPTALTYAFFDPAVLAHHHGSAGPAAPAPPTDDAGIAAHAYTVHFERANPRAALTATVPTAGERNYFTGSDATHWASHVGGFRQLRYAGLWPGIDLTLYENAQQRLEYDVLLAPRANPARVALRYDGASNLTLDAAGNLLIKTTLGTTTELAPRAWQLDAAGRPQAVACRYVLTGATLSFALGPYDHSRALTIDPTVQFSTLTGSTADNWGFTATYDEAGNMYSGGIAFGLGFPATTGAYRTSFGGLVDIALIKYNTAVSGAAARVWATYLGGENTEFPQSLVVNAQNELVVLGSTSSRGYPTSAGCLQPSFGGGTPLDPFRAAQYGSYYAMSNGSDLVLSRLSASGSALLASTYLGGTGNDGVVPPSSFRNNYGDDFRSDVLLDAAGNVYVASATSSLNFPGLARGFNATYQGGQSDGVVCMLPPSLASIGWAGLLGGTGADGVYSIQRDGRGQVFVCGATTQFSQSAASNFPVTPGALHTAFLGGGVDGFAARISADGRRLERCTFIGTASYDKAYFLQLDAAGSVYLFGQTLGSFPVTPGLYNTPQGTQFIQKLDAELATSLYSTAFGTTARVLGGPNLVPTAFLVDDCERVYISGWGGLDNDQAGQWLGGSTAGLATTANAMQRTTDGSDFYLAQFAPGMTTLDYATFFGQNSSAAAEHVDGGTSRFDKRGVVYQAVCAGCQGNQGFPQPPGAGTYTIRNGSSNCNNGAFKMNFEVLQADPGPRRYVCLDGGAVSLGGTPSGGVWSGPGVAGTAGSYRFVPTAVGPGQYVLSYTVATTGICQSTRTVRYVVAPPVTPVIAPVPPQCVAGASVALVATPAGGTFAGPGVSGGRFDPAVAGAGTHTLTYTVTDSLGCGVGTRQVVVSRPPAVVPGPDTTLCADQRQPFQLRGFAPAGGTWSGAGVTPGGVFTPPNTNNRGGVFALTYTFSQGPCQSQGTRTVVVAPTASQNVALNLPLCEALPQYAGLAPFDCPLRPVLLAPRATYQWDFGDGSPISTDSTPVHRYQQPGAYRVQLLARYGTCEVLTGFAPVEVGQPIIPNIITPNGDQLNDTFQPHFSCLRTSLEVYTRWGQRVYQTDDYHNDWDARSLSDGLYYFLLRDAEGQRAKGWVEVRR